MSDVDEPRWLDDVARELRADVPVRSAWRARLITEVAALPQPRRGGRLERWLVGRPIMLRPLTAIAAGLVLVLAGAGVATMWIRGESVAKAPTGVAASTMTREVRFVLDAPRATRVSLVGDFNRWNPSSLPLVRDPASGSWRVSVALPPGRHVYAFVVDGDLTADPSAPRAAEEDFGTPNSVVVVSGPST